MSEPAPAPSLTRLLLVCEPGKDGAFDHVASLFAHLRRAHPEVRIDLACSSRRSRPVLDRLIEAVRAGGGEAVDLQIGNAPQAADLHACRQILDLVRRRQPQIVHAHSSKAGGLCRLLGALWPNFPPVVYTPHAYFGMGRQRAASALVFNGIERLLGRVGTSIAVSYDERAFGVGPLGVPPRHLVLIDNGIDTDRFHPVDRATREQYRAEFQLPRDATIFVTVGRDSHQKNYRPLYLAMSRVLADAGRPVFFVHAGAGAEARGLTLPPAAQARYRGFEHVDGIERLLAASDAFVLVSRYETLCLSALQGIATGLKMLLTRAPGNTCLERVGFREIAWIPFAEETEPLAASIEHALRQWLAAPLPATEHQVALARRRIAAKIQLEKVHRLYLAILKKKFLPPR